MVRLVPRPSTIGEIHRNINRASGRGCKRPLVQDRGYPLSIVLLAVANRTVSQSHNYITNTIHGCTVAIYGGWNTPPPHGSQFTANLEVNSQFTANSDDLSQFTGNSRAFIFGPPWFTIRQT